MRNQKNGIRYVLAGLFLCLLSFSAYSESYWQKILACEDSGAGYAYFDVDLANRRGLQFVIKNREIIRYLTSNLRYRLYPGQVKIYDNGEVAAIEGNQSNPVFSGNDVRGFEHQGSLGAGYGWYPGIKVDRQGDTVRVEVVNNAYYHCRVYQGLECIDGYWVQREVPKDWLFRNCR